MAESGVNKKWRAEYVIELSTLPMSSYSVDKFEKAGATTVGDVKKKTLAHWENYVGKGVLKEFLFVIYRMSHGVRSK